MRHFSFELVLVICAALGGGCNGTSGAGPTAGAAAIGSSGTGASPGTSGQAAPAGTGVVAAGSGSAAGGGASGSGGATSANPPTFTAVFEDVIAGTGCNAGTTCHGGGVGMGMLSMTNKMAAYNALVDMPAAGINVPAAPMDCKDSGLKRVVKGSPDQSLLMKKLEGMQPCGKPMPPNPPLLKAERVAQVRAWIMAGAPNN